MAVIYAVIVGFTVVALWEASVTANNEVSAEASKLLQLHEGNFVLGSAASTRINADVVGVRRCGRARLVDHRSGDAEQQVQRRLRDIYVTLNAYQPRTAAEADYPRGPAADVNSLSQARVTRQLEAREAGSLPAVLWVGILVTTAVTLGFALLFSLESLRFAWHHDRGESRWCWP